MQMREKVADEMHRIQATNRTWTMEQLADAAIAAMWPLAMERAGALAHLRRDCATGEIFTARPDDLPSGRPSGSVELSPSEIEDAIRNLPPPQGDEGDVG